MMGGELRYRVVAAMVRFRSASPTPDGIRIVRDAGPGQVLAAREIDPRHLAHLLSLKMIEAEPDAAG
jgi:hypothetical protein